MNAVLAAAWVTHLGKSAEDARAAKHTHWVATAQQFSPRPNEPYSLDLLRFLASESETLEYKAQGLPADQLSIQNGVIILHATGTVPFIVDPNSQGARWLQTHLVQPESAVELSPSKKPASAVPGGRLLRPR